MKLKYDFDCEKCKNKDICKYYTETSRYCKKELDVKFKPKEEVNKENLTITVNCKYYNSEETVLNYPEGCRSLGSPNSTAGWLPLPYTLCNNSHIDTRSNLEESSRNVSKIITSKKHI